MSINRTTKTTTMMILFREAFGFSFCLDAFTPTMSWSKISLYETMLFLITSVDQETKGKKVHICDIDPNMNGVETS